MCFEIKKRLGNILNAFWLKKTKLCDIIKKIKEKVKEKVNGKKSITK